MARPMQRIVLLRLTLLLGGLLTGAEIDLFAPGLPQIQHVFDVSTFALEWCVGGNLLVCCVASLALGRLADAHGRRPVALWGLAAFICGSAMCTLAPQFLWLIVGRVLQGAGTAALAVVSHVLLTETCAPQEQPRLLGAINGATTLAMSGAPLLGSWLVRTVGWRGPFATLWAMALVCWALMAIVLPGREAVVRQPRLTRPVLSPTLVCSGIALCLFTAPYWIFVGLAPLLYMQGMAVPLSTFGRYMGALTAVFGGVSLLSPIFIRMVGLGCAVAMGCSACCLAAVGIAWCGMTGASAAAITTVVALYSAGVVLPYNTLYPLFLRTAGAAKSRAAAALVCGRLVTTSLGLQAAAWLYDGRFFALAWIMAGGIFAALGATLALHLHAMRRRASTGEAVKNRALLPSRRTPAGRIAPPIVHNAGVTYPRR